MNSALVFQILKLFAKYSKNVLCCCANRHPSSDISKLIDHLQETLSNLTKENKLIAIMGDFNIDLLKYDDHIPTNEFVNMLLSYHFQPTILHPIRIIDTSSTVIDNIYVNNTIDTNINSGNTVYDL